MNILRKPWWLRPFCGDRTITLWPNTYPEAAYWRTSRDPKWFPTLSHEKVHLKQQAGETRGYLRGKLKLITWEFRYLTSKEFRLAAEAGAYTMELMVASPSDRNWRYWKAVKALAGAAYGHCAPTEEDAQKAIIGACWDQDFHYVPGPRP